MSSQLALTKTETTNIFKGSSSPTVGFPAQINLLSKDRLLRLKAELLSASALFDNTTHTAFATSSKLSIFGSSLLQDSTYDLVKILISEVEREISKDLVTSQNIDAIFEGEGYKATRDRLIALLREDDDGECKPTSHAFSSAWTLVTDATRKLQKHFPKASAAVDDECGIRLRWRNLDKTREVSLYCPSDGSEDAYIYHEQDNEYDADYNVSGLSLANWLSWLTKND